VLRFQKLLTDLCKYFSNDFLQATILKYLEIISEILKPSTKQSTSITSYLIGQVIIILRLFPFYV
jgi:hypothetical protein